MLIPKPPKYPSRVTQPSVSLQFQPPNAGGFQIYFKTSSEQLIFQAQTCSAASPGHQRKRHAQNVTTDQEPSQPLYLLMACDFVPAPAQLLGKFQVLLLQSRELLGLLSCCQLERLAVRTQSASLP